MTDWNDPLRETIAERLAAGSGPRNHITDLEVTARKVLA